MSQDDIEKIRIFISKLNFTEEDIQSYVEEFHIPEVTMRSMANRITKELKNDLETILTD